METILRVIVKTSTRTHVFFQVPDRKDDNNLMRTGFRSSYGNIQENVHSEFAFHKKQVAQKLKPSGASLQS